MKRILIVATGLALLVAACAESASSETPTTSSSVVTTTSLALITTASTSPPIEPDLVWPPRLVAPGLVYDESTNSLLLFGGGAGIDILDASTVATNVTWLFDVDALSWRRVKPSMVPPSRTLAALAYDSQDEKIVMIGGDPAPAPLFNTWIYYSDRQDWRIAGRGPISKEREQQLNVTNGLIGAPIAYDSESDRTVVLGGAVYVGDRDSPISREYLVLDETWVYDSDTATWENMQPDPHPVGRVDHGLVYDPESDRILAWGGITQETLWDLSPDAPYDPNVWAYNYNTNTWTEHINENGPRPVGSDGPITFDTESDRMVVIREGAEVWSYDLNTNTWLQQPPTSPQPINTAFSGITYIGGETDRVALYGGCIKTVDNYADFSRDFPAYCSNELWFYDLNTNTWEKIGPPDQ